MEIYILGYLIAIIGGILALIRLYQYTFGAYGNYIKMPGFAYFLVFVGIWTPFLNYIALAYALLWCKPVEALMSAREEFIKNATPEDIVNITEQYILNSNLINDEWVVNTWGKSSTLEWIKRLSTNPKALKQTLEQNIQMHASEVLAYAIWNDVIMSYLYLDERDNLNATI